jgi:hypothetical protein
MEELKPTIDQQPNLTISKDAPITGGETKVVINELVVRQNIRSKYDIASFTAAINSAESRYNPRRIQLYDMYQHALLDGHLFGIVEKRINSVLNKSLVYKNKQGEAVEAMTEVIKSYEFRQIMRLILESIPWGISGIEFIPGKELQLRAIPRKHIKTKTQLITVEQMDQDYGIDYTKLDNVWIIGEPEDLGILLPASMYVIYKRNALSDFANFIQIFGIPIRVAKYEVNDKTTQTALKDALDNSGSALALMIPKQAEFSIEDGKTSNANGDLQTQFIDKMDQFLSVIILGNTETTTNGKTGSQAKSKVHQEQQNELLKSDMALLQAYLNDPHFIRILQSYALPVEDGGQFEFNKDVDINFLSARAEVDKTLIECGVPIGVEYFYETYNIPKPEPGELIVGTAAQATKHLKAEEQQEATNGQQETDQQEQEEQDGPNLVDNALEAVTDRLMQRLKDAGFFA